MLLEILTLTDSKRKSSKTMFRSINQQKVCYISLDEKIGRFVIVYIKLY